ncbi:lipocalin-like domain-containing protein [Prevotella sp. HUN102]|uniref:lipocalin-like domain-containing protein n=1 Tax=Prevotella sp. HUN102 TaxID=1392486 RepID=UPI00056984E1|nr:lipocalin-like domain-containing protein [Prevotella sp. HUN102]
MKIKQIKILFAILVAMLGLASCSLFETDNAPEELEGMWYLTEKKTYDGTADCRSQRIFWSFQGKLLELEDKSRTHSSILYHYAKEGSKLVLENPYRYDRENGDELLTEPSLLLFYGINSLSVTYTISINDDKLILNDGQNELHFIKF